MRGSFRSFSLFLDKILGRPLRSSDASKEALGIATGVPALGLDALASTAYGPEAALAILAPLSVAGLHYMPAITLVVGPGLVWLFWTIQRHYQSVARAIEAPVKLECASLRATMVILPFRSWNRITEMALRFSLDISEDIIALHINSDEGDNAPLRQLWTEKVEEPARAAKTAVPRLEIIQTSYRQLYDPILKFVRETRKENKDRLIAVVIPELVQPHWYEYLLHNLHGAVLRGLLLMEGDQRTMVITTPWYLREK